MILESRQRQPIEFRVPTNVPLRIDQGYSTSQMPARQSREIGPQQRVARRGGRDEACFALELGGDFGLEMTAQQHVGGDDRTNDGGGHEQGDAREQPRGEPHRRRRGGGGGSRNR